ncbi:hypothetical protein PspTeo4_43520 [Pseudomonas sp. Teo4]|nr:hypothetical protein [Pseudomonas sp. Teo4]
MFGLTLALFELLTYLASDAVMPAMPVVVDHLNASPEYIPHALNLYLLGGVVLQWLIGPLADRYGRRPCSWPVASSSAWLALRPSG